MCDNIRLSGQSGDVQGLEEIELLRCCFAGAVEDAVADMSGVFLDPGEKIECRSGADVMFPGFQPCAHDAVEHECEKADQRMSTDAVRQSVMNRGEFDIGFKKGCRAERNGEVS